MYDVPICVRADGNVKYQKKRNQGQILLTHNSIYVLKVKNGDHLALVICAVVGGILGGAIGAGLLAVVYLAIAKIFFTPKSLPDFMETSDISSLEDSVKNKILRSELLAKLFYKNLEVTETWLGFIFKDGDQQVEYQGKLQKGKIKKFLELKDIGIGKIKE